MVVSDYLKHNINVIMSTGLRGAPTGSLLDASETDITEQVVYYVTLTGCVPLVCYLIFTASNLNAKNKPETVPLTSSITGVLYKLKETYSWSLLFSEQLPGFSQQDDFGSEGFL